MKKLFALVLAVAMLASMATVAFAAENTTTKSTTLTTTVPTATYTLNIPENQEITYGEEKSFIGNVTITDGVNFEKGKNIEVAVMYSGKFEADNVSTTIPFTVLASQYKTADESSSFYGEIVISDGECLTFHGKSDTTVSEKAYAEFKNGSSSTKEAYVESLCISIKGENWGKALAGEYTATIMFTAEVVVEE